MLKFGKPEFYMMEGALNMQFTSPVKGELAGYAGEIGNIFNLRIELMGDVATGEPMNENFPEIESIEVTALDMRFAEYVPPAQEWCNEHLSEIRDSMIKARIMIW